MSVLYNVVVSTPTAAGREAWLCIVQLFTDKETHRSFVEAATTFDLSPSMLRALLSLKAGEHIPMRTLVEEWHCDPSWVTSVVDELEGRGLVERRIDRVDRRAKTVTITDAGLKRRGEAQALIAVPPSAITTLSATEQRTLRDLLRKVTAALPDLG